MMGLTSGVSWEMTCMLPSQDAFTVALLHMELAHVVMMVLSCMVKETGMVCRKELKFTRSNKNEIKMPLKEWLSLNLPHYSMLSWKDYYKVFCAQDK